MIVSWDWTCFRSVWWLSRAISLFGPMSASDVSGEGACLERILLSQIIHDFLTPDRLRAVRNRPGCVLLDIPLQGAESVEAVANNVEILEPLIAQFVEPGIPSYGTFKAGFTKQACTMVFCQRNRKASLSFYLRNL